MKPDVAQESCHEESELLALAQVDGGNLHCLIPCLLCSDYRF
jgi:hypothetical protein